MKIVTIGSLKGGVSKTNFAFNLSCFLTLEKNKLEIKNDKKLKSIFDHQK